VFSDLYVRRAVSRSVQLTYSVTAGLTNLQFHAAKLNGRNVLSARMISPAKNCHSNNSNNCAVETGYVNIVIKLQGFHELGMCFRPMWTLFGQDVPPAVEW